MNALTKNSELSWSSSVICMHLARLKRISVCCFLTLITLPRSTNKPLAPCSCVQHWWLYKEKKGQVYLKSGDSVVSRGMQRTQQHNSLFFEASVLGFLSYAFCVGLLQVRHHALRLVESFDIDDVLVHSPLGLSAIEDEPLLKVVQYVETKYTTYQWPSWLAVAY